jgi:hypothetical protein
MKTKHELALAVVGILLIIAGLLALTPVRADEEDNGEYQVSYRQGDDGLWRMDLSANHLNEIYRLAAPFELEMGFVCQYEAVNHFYYLFGRLYGITLAPFPAPPNGC